MSLKEHFDSSSEAEEVTTDSTDWPTYKQTLHHAVTSSSTRIRIHALKQISNGRNLQLNEKLDVLRLLIYTVPLYGDQASRDQVLATLQVLLTNKASDDAASAKLENSVFQAVCNWLSKEVATIFKAETGATTAPTNRYSLLLWCYTVLSTAYRFEGTAVAETPQWPALVHSISLLVDSLVDSTAGAKPALSKSVVTNTRRAIRNAPKLIPALLEALTAGKSQQAVMLGFVIAVAQRIKSPKLATESKQAVVDSQDVILSYYVDKVVMSKTALPQRTLNAFDDFVSAFVTPEQLTSRILPSMEKMLLRSPEAVLPTMNAFFRQFADSATTSSIFSSKLSISLLTASKSTNASTRTASVELFSTLMQKLEKQSDYEKIVDEYTSLLSSGKTSSADQRTTLFSMLSTKPDSQVNLATASEKILNSCTTVLAKEANENALIAMMTCISIYLPSSSGKSAVKPLASALAKAMQDSKPAIRKPVVSGVGKCLWSTQVEQIDDSFLAAILPALETNLKNASANPLTNPAGPLEGYVAVALFESLNSPKLDAARLASPVLQSILAHGVKPSFLLWDRILKKTSTMDEEVWLLRAMSAVVRRRQTQIEESSSLISEVAMPIIWVAVESKHHGSRKEAAQIVRQLSSDLPAYTHSLFVPALRTFLSTLDTQSAGTSQDESIVDRSGGLRQVIQGLTTFSSGAENAEKMEVACGLAVLAHHPALGKEADSLWIDCLLANKLDPQEAVKLNVEALLNITQPEISSASPTSLNLQQAAYRTRAVLSLVSPDLILPRLVSQVQKDLDPTTASSFSPLDLAIWAADADTPYVDVLAPATPTSQRPVKGKERAIQEWEDNIRKSLAAKKQNGIQKPKTLTKAEKGLIDAQLAKEAEIRSSVDLALDRLRRGLDTVQAIWRYNPQLQPIYASAFIEAVVPALRLPIIVQISQAAFTCWMILCNSMAQELATFRTALAIAVLRGTDCPIVPEEHLAESLSTLVLRVLYRVQFLSQSKPFDSITFMLLYPLLAKVITAGGLDVPAEERDLALEQVSLAMDAIVAHCHSASQASFPRIAVIQLLLSSLSQYPSLTKTASTGLVTLAEAMQDSATASEIETIERGALVDESHIRLACLQAVQPLDLTIFDFSKELWLLRHDDDLRNAKLASAIFDENGLQLPREFVELLIPYLDHQSTFARSACARSIQEALTIAPDQLPILLDKLCDLYKDKNRLLVPEFDQFGMVIESTLNREDPWRTRKAIASALKAASVHFDSASVQTLFNLLLVDGALGDRSQDVRSEMLEAATSTIDLKGQESLQPLIALFEKQLGTKSSEFDPDTTDRIIESTVVLYGRLAKHLEPTDSRINAVVERLIEALRTPSEVVQVAVSECLPPLIKLRHEEAPAIIDRLLHDLFYASKYAERRGAAYGLAGCIRGRGIASIREFNIIARFRDALEDKKNATPKQGAMFAIECFTVTLGRIFEPFIVQILPLLLTALGDASVDVREATSDAARAIMARISGYAVKLILPTLLDSLDDKQWRSKKGAIDLMGNMAYLAPRQLAISLPVIVPRLTDVLTDTHTQVRSAANGSLKRFGEVVTNPEIQQIQSILLDALVDPAKKTLRALDTLIKTSFAHFIDSSSLAIVVPILDRGLRERSAEVKRKSAQIVGNMATLTDSKDLQPYLSQLIPLVRTVLVDPVPEARATAAKALGGLVERLGEDAFPNLVDSLLEILQSDSSGVDQQGAAQGLAEIIGGLGVERLEDLLPDIISNTSSLRAYVREGYISLLVFLPSVFGDRFSPYLGRIIQPILSGLADDSDYVRDASMRAGRMIVTNHSTKAIDLLLPELETGLFDVSWRIRQSSIQLVGELLFKIVGITAKADIGDEEDKEEEEDRQTSENSKKQLLEVLGKERRDRVLAAVYIVRQDPSGLVRKLSVHVWKALVHNTPRTVREMLPTLIQILVRILSGGRGEQAETASRTLGELCRKLGESILGEVIPILQTAATGDVQSRRGVCLAYIEILANTTRQQLESHEDNMIAAIRKSLIDEDEDVRVAAAQAFDALQRQLGPRAIDETLPSLLQALGQSGTVADAALAALREIMTVRANVVIPVLVPTLTKQPITLVNAKALSSLVTVAGPALGSKLEVVLSALEQSKQNEKDEDVYEQLEATISALFASISDLSGLNSILMLLLSMTKEKSGARKISGCQLFSTFCRTAQIDHADYDIGWLRQLVSLQADTEEGVAEASHAALESLVKTISKEDMEGLSVPLRRTIESLGEPGIFVHGFTKAAGLKPLLPIFHQGLTAGTAEQREQSAYGFGELVVRTPPENIKPYVPQIAGPLIRIVSERVPAPVKSAILSTLTTLLLNIPMQVRPFFPQIQRTFVKNLADSASQSVRSKSAAGLGALMVHQPRVDPLITELLTGAQNQEEYAIREAYSSALTRVILSGGKNASAPARTAIVEFLDGNLAQPSQKETWNLGIARALSALVNVDAESAGPLISRHVLSVSHDTAMASIALQELAESSLDALKTLQLFDKATTMAERLCQSDQPGLSRPGKHARESLKV